MFRARSNIRRTNAESLADHRRRIRRHRIVQQVQAGLEPVHVVRQEGEVLTVVIGEQPVSLWIQSCRAGVLSAELSSPQAVEIQEAE
jgi:hypothetical protein